MQARRPAACLLTHIAGFTEQRRCLLRTTDEAKGIDALLALAVAGEESLGMGSDSDEEAAPARRKPKPRGTPQRRARPAYDEDEEEEPADAGVLRCAALRCAALCSSRVSFGCCFSRLATVWTVVWISACKQRWWGWAVLKLSCAVAFCRAV